jgi:hypothetical protein
MVMTDAKIYLSSFHKDVLVTISDEGDFKEAFNDAARFVRMLEANGQIRDAEAGIDSPRATHEIVKQEDGCYRLNRVGFGLF